MPLCSLRVRLPLLLALVCTTLSMPGALAQQNPFDPAGPEIASFIEETLQRHGLERETVLATLMQARHQPQVLRLIAPASPGMRKNWKAYRSRFIEPTRIRAGLRYWQQNAATLARAEREYGVPAEIIVAILGIETIYGRNMGDFRVLDTLTTLAFYYPPASNRDARIRLFREQLGEFLAWCRDTRRDPLDPTGSFAGAIGQPQFMPSSIRRFAVDFDGDGSVDLRNSAGDSIGSVAHFLREHGWESGRPVMWHIGDDHDSRRVAERFADGRAELTTTLEVLLQAGLRVDDIAELGKELQTRALIVDLPTPEAPTEYAIGLQNFIVLTYYNRSFFYAQTVFEFAQALRSERDLPIARLTTARSSPHSGREHARR